MTTATYSTPITHTAAAGFQAWGSALSAAMQTCGLAQTADTGQINWSTVAFPASGVSAGYEIYKFTDALQATYPVFIKIEYGSGSPGNSVGYGCPMIWVTAGTATDGAGNLTGTTTTREACSFNNGGTSGIGSNTTPYPTYICFDGSYLGVVHKIGANTAGNDASGFSNGVFMIGRTTDSTGAYVGGHIVQLTANNTTNAIAAVFIMQALNTTTNTLYSTTNGYYSIVPFSMTTSSIAGSGNYQVFPCYVIDNQVIPLNWVCYGITAETTQGNTMQTTIVGSTQQTYLSLGQAGYGAALPTSSTYTLLMKYQ